MITFEQIKKANESIKTTDVKGKEYAEVNQRIKAFRMVFPNGSIQTSIISLDNGVCTMQTKVFNEDGILIATGYAQEKENSTFINKTSFIENCETSAVGRALGMCGFGIDTSVASKEEVENAIANQEKAEKKKASKEEVKEELDFRKLLVIYCKENNIDINEVSKNYQLSRQSTNSDFEQALKQLKGE